MRSERRAGGRLPRTAMALAAAVVALAGTTAADVPLDSDWQFLGTERVVVRMLGRRIVEKGDVAGALAVGADGVWSMEAFAGTAYAAEVTGALEDRPRNRFVLRMDEPSRAAFGEALRRMLVDGGAAEATVRRIRSRARGHEREDGTLRIRSVVRVRLRVRAAGRVAPVRMRCTDLWTCWQD